jgi:hypothetical protein
MHRGIGIGIMKGQGSTWSYDVLIFALPCPWLGLAWFDVGTGSQGERGRGREGGRFRDIALVLRRGIISQGIFTMGGLTTVGVERPVKSKCQYGILTAPGIGGMIGTIIGIEWGNDTLVNDER